MRSARRHLVATAPAVLLCLGVVGLYTLRPAGRRDLRQPLDEFPSALAGYERSGERVLTGAELTALRPDSYLLRTYESEHLPRLDLYIAFYGRQASGSSVHSPRNCLPGSGWEPVQHDRLAIETSLGRGTVNRYVVEHESGSRALVFYWYQGRGRVEASEYRVKWDLVRDALLRRRTDEALVRVVFPLGRARSPSEVDAASLLVLIAEALHPHLPS